MGKILMFFTVFASSQTVIGQTTDNDVVDEFVDTEIVDNSEQVADRLELVDNGLDQALAENSYAEQDTENEDEFDDQDLQENEITHEDLQQTAADSEQASIEDVYISEDSEAQYSSDLVENPEHVETHQDGDQFQEPASDLNVVDSNHVSSMQGTNASQSETIDQDVQEAEVEHSEIETTDVADEEGTYVDSESVESDQD